MINYSHIKTLSFTVVTLLLLLVIPINSFSQRSFKKESIEQYKKDKDYDYFKQKQLKPEKKKEVNHTSYSTSISIGPLVRIILIILLILILGFIIYSIASGNKGYKNYDNKKISDQVIEQIVDEEKIEENDFDALLKLALSKEEYRSALRIMFLKSLQILNKKGIITYEKNKTNYEYLSEINKAKLKSSFLQASDSFSWVWYANTPESINKETFLILEPHFNTLLKEIE